MRSPAGNAEFFNNRATAGARQAFAAEDTGEIHVAAFFALGVNVSVVRRAAFFNRQVHDFAQFVKEHAKFLFRNASYEALRVEFRTP